MMKLKYILSILAFFFTTQLASAQQGMFNIKYSIGMPAADLADYTGETSFRGIGLEYQHVLGSRLALGISGGINTFYEQEFTTLTEGTSSLTGIQYRYTNNLPLMATVSYFLATEQRLLPYAGLGIGTLYSLRDTEIGTISLSEDAWAFSLRPELGVIYQVSEGFALKAAATYIQAFDTPELGNQSYGTFDVGIVLSPTRRRILQL